MMFGYIYKTTNMCNGKIYIGKKHSQEFIGESYLGSGVKLQCAINKYGKENFKVEMIDQADTIEELNKKEIYYIQELNSQDPKMGYNIANGGDGGIVWGSPENHPSKKTDRCGCKNPSFNKKWYTNGNTSIYLGEDDEIPVGYHLGNHRTPNKGRITIYDSDGNRKSVLPEELEYYESTGWITSITRNALLKEQIKNEKLQARLKKKREKELLKTIEKQNRPQRNAWNKGLTKDTDDRVRLLAESKIGHHYNCGWHHSEESKQKISQSRLGYKPSQETIDKQKSFYKNMTEEQRAKRSKNCAEGQKSLCWVTNEFETIRIHKEELHHYLDDGYVRGRGKLNKN